MQDLLSAVEDVCGVDRRAGSAAVGSGVREAGGPDGAAGAKHRVVGSIDRQDAVLGTEAGQKGADLLGDHLMVTGGEGVVDLKW